MENKSLLEIYSQIKTPFELLDFMNKYIKFGFYGNNQIYDTSDLDALDLASNIYWNLSNPVHTLNLGYGQCFDQVELERDWFLAHNYPCKTLYITFLVDGINSYPTHAYLAYKENDKWHWFENCDKANFGIHDYESLGDLITDQMIKHVSFTEKFNPIDQDIVDTLHIFEYERPSYGTNADDFRKFLVSSYDIPIVE